MPVEDKALQKRFFRQYLAEIRPGWTFDYIDELMGADDGNLEDLMAYLDGKSRAMDELNRDDG